MAEEPVPASCSPFSIRIFAPAPCPNGAWRQGGRGARSRTNIDNRRLVRRGRPIICPAHVHFRSGERLDRSRTSPRSVSLAAPAYGVQRLVTFYSGLNMQNRYSTRRTVLSIVRGFLASIYIPSFIPILLFPPFCHWLAGSII